jgi:HSP20 family protein
MARAKQSLERGGERGHEMRGREPQSMRGGMQFPVTPFAPFSMMNRFAEEMERMFEDLGIGRSWLASRIRPGMAEIGQAMWSPQIEIFERGGQFIVRADLPGLTKDNVKVDITDEALIIQGERKQEHEEDREGWHRSERSYGSFYRSIPLPEGIKAEEAKANFRDGVLEISMPAPQHEGRRRQIDIS